jgi:hypothetical protein
MRVPVSRFAQHTAGLCVCARDLPARPVGVRDEAAALVHRLWTWTEHHVDHHVRPTGSEPAERDALGLRRLGASGLPDHRLQHARNGACRLATSGRQRARVPDLPSEARTTARQCKAANSAPNFDGTGRPPWPPESTPRKYAPTETRVSSPTSTNATAASHCSVSGRSTLTVLSATLPKCADSRDLSNPWDHVKARRVGRSGPIATHLLRLTGASERAISRTEIVTAHCV